MHIYIGTTNREVWRSIVRGLIVSKLTEEKKGEEEEERPFMVTYLVGFTLETFAKLSLLYGAR